MYQMLQISITDKPIYVHIFKFVHINNNIAISRGSNIKCEAKQVINTCSGGDA